jgi:hypothetical protein
MSKPPTRKLTGRPVPDDKGNASWVWHAEGEVDTALVRALGEELTLGATPEERTSQGLNPYDQTSTVSPSQEAGSRRTLDDMRRLSEKIKRTKHWKREE